jgi:hypothetical protein
MERSKETLVMFVEKNRYDEKKDFSEKKNKSGLFFSSLTSGQAQKGQSQWPRL